MLTSHEFARAAVIGAGLMGRRIAGVLASAGLEVAITDINAEILSAAAAEACEVAGAQRGSVPRPRSCRGSPSAPCAPSTVNSTPQTSRSACGRSCLTPAVGFRCPAPTACRSSSSTTSRRRRSRWPGRCGPSTATCCADRDCPSVAKQHNGFRWGSPSGCFFPSWARRCGERRRRGFPR
ncbi:hypothetical protein B1T47_00730, partial [Mycobacterium kansasii]